MSDTSLTLLSEVSDTSLTLRRREEKWKQIGGWRRRRKTSGPACANLRINAISIPWYRTHANEEWGLPEDRSNRPRVPGCDPVGPHALRRTMAMWRTIALAAVTVSVGGEAAHAQQSAFDRCMNGVAAAEQSGFQNCTRTTPQARTDCNLRVRDSAERGRNRCIANEEQAQLTARRRAAEAEQRRQRGR